MEKKIARMTWLHNGNYGSILQAYALQRFLLDAGYDVTDLDYCPTAGVRLANWIQSGNSPSLFLGKFREAAARRACPYPEAFRQRAEAFRRFRRDYLRLSPPLKNPGELKREAASYDLFLCGSDQIWSPALLNPVYYLDFVPRGKTRIAYAPSFGVTRVPAGKRRKMAAWMERFDYLSAREPQGRELIRRLTGRDAPVLTDPAMLPDREEWLRLAGQAPRREPYILCYLLTPNRAYTEAVRDYAGYRGLPVVLIPGVRGPFGTGFEEKASLGPEQWLGYIAHARAVCTDSFHAALFSALFRKEWILFRRFSDRDPGSENSRVYHLTRMLGARERLLGPEDLDRIRSLPDPDFGRMEQAVRREAEKSGAWLLDILKHECRR